MDFDQLERSRSCIVAVDLRVDGLDQRGLAHAARAPEEGVVGRQTTGEAGRVLLQGVAGAIDALQEHHVDPVHVRNGREAGWGRVPDEGVGRREIGLFRRGRRKALEALGDALQKRGDGGIGVSGLAHGSNPETLGFPLAGGVTRVTQARLHSLFPASLRNRSHLLST